MNSEKLPTRHCPMCCAPLHGKESNAKKFVLYYYACPSCGWKSEKYDSAEDCARCLAEEVDCSNFLGVIKENEQLRQRVNELMRENDRLDEQVKRFKNYFAKLKTRAKERQA